MDSAEIHKVERRQRFLWMWRLMRARGGTKEKGRCGISQVEIYSHRLSDPESLISREEDDFHFYFPSLSSRPDRHTHTPHTRTHTHTHNRQWKMNADKHSTRLFAPLSARSSHLCGIALSIREVKKMCFHCDDKGGVSWELFDIKRRSLKNYCLWGSSFFGFHFTLLWLKANWELTWGLLMKMFGLLYCVAQTCSQPPHSNRILFFLYNSPVIH